MSCRDFISSARRKTTARRANLVHAPNVVQGRGHRVVVRAQTNTLLFQSLLVEGQGLVEFTPLVIPVGGGGHGVLHRRAAAVALQHLLQHRLALGE